MCKKSMQKMLKFSVTKSTMKRHNITPHIPRTCLFFPKKKYTTNAISLAPLAVKSDQKRSLAWQVVAGATKICFLNLRKAKTISPLLHPRGKIHPLSALPSLNHPAAVVQFFFFFIAAAMRILRA